MESLPILFLTKKEINTTFLQKVVRFLANMSIDKKTESISKTNTNFLDAILSEDQKYLDLR